MLESGFLYSKEVDPICDPGGCKVQTVWHTGGRVQKRFPWLWDNRSVQRERATHRWAHVRVGKRPGRGSLLLDLTGVNPRLGNDVLNGHQSGVLWPTDVS